MGRSMLNDCEKLAKHSPQIQYHLLKILDYMLRKKMLKIIFFVYSMFMKGRASEPILFAEKGFILNIFLKSARQKKTTETVLHKKQLK